MAGLIGISGSQRLHGSEAGGTGGFEEMTHREHLAQADRFIAECKNRIARQRESIATAYENGHSTDIPVSMLRAAGGKPAFLREAPLPDPRSAKKRGPATAGKNRITIFGPKLTALAWWCGGPSGSGIVTQIPRKQCGRHAGTDETRAPRFVPGTYPSNLR